jgi:hypothetical protein
MDRVEWAMVPVVSDRRVAEAACVRPWAKHVVLGSWDELIEELGSIKAGALK